MDLKKLEVVILAAGKGKRFGESYTKLLHPIFDRPLIYYPIQNLINLGIKNIVAVVSEKEVEEAISKNAQVKFVYQNELNGTAKAVELALERIPDSGEIVMVLNGDDATLYTKKTLEEFLKSHESSRADISMMTMKSSRNMETGKVIRDSKKNFSKILEHKEYLEEAVKSNEINCGVYLINLNFLKNNLKKIDPAENGEYYLTNLLNIARRKKAELIFLF